MLEIDHIGYAVKDTDGKKMLMNDLLGFNFIERIVYEREEATSKLDFYETKNGVIELVEVDNPDASINEFIKSYGEGFHHICFEVEDLESTMEEWKSKGVTFSVEPPRYGSRGGYITFTDRETTGGVAIELIEYKKND